MYSTRNFTLLPQDVHACIKFICKRPKSHPTEIVAIHKGKQKRIIEMATILNLIRLLIYKIIQRHVIMTSRCSP
jgi:hypothetical protein